MSVQEEDYGWDKILSDLNSLKNMIVEVGYDQNSGDEGTIGLAELASIHEFGNEHVPERPFMRESFDRSAEQLTETGYTLADKVISGKIDPEMAYEIWGDSYKTAVQKGVIGQSLGLEENAQSTIDRKGSDTPLVDTGRLINGIEVNVI